MSTTILTDEQKAQFVTDIADYGADFVAPLFAVVESIEQAIMQSTEIQAWKRDAERYRWLRDKANPADWEFISHQSPDVVDVEVDAAMEKQP